MLDNPTFAADLAPLLVALIANPSDSGAQTAFTAALTNLLNEWNVQVSTGTLAQDVVALTGSVQELLTDFSAIALKGTVATVSALPAGAANGTAYVVTATGHGYARVGGNWIDIGALQGPQGAAGISGTVAIGTVTTGAPGSAAAVTNAGSPTAAVLSFAIPQGPVGATGATGSTGQTGAQGATGLTGTTGAQGYAGWSPVFALVANGSGGYVLQVASWTGGAGAAPAAGQYVGPSGLVGTAAAAVNLLGPQGATGQTGATGATGATGSQGLQGYAGWSPILAAVSNGSGGVVLQVSDWEGGSGAKPATGQYVGPSGLVSAIGSAVNIEGPQGATGATGQSFVPSSTGGASGRSAYDTEPTGWSYLATDTGTLYFKNSSTSGDWSAGFPFGTGATGAAGSNGTNGWSPILSAVSNGSGGTVLQVSDWEGGTGTRPATGQYVGPSGLVSSAASAVNIQGPQGQTGAQGPTGAQGSTGPAGAAGSTGSAGATGAAGARGSLWYEGSGAPGTIAGAQASDLYLNTATADVYQYASGAWAKVGNLGASVTAPAITSALGFAPASQTDLGNVQADLAQALILIAQENSKSFGITNGFVDVYVDETEIDLTNSTGINWSIGKVSNLAVTSCLPSTFQGVAPWLLIDFGASLFQLAGVTYPSFAALMAAAGGTIGSTAATSTSGLTGTASNGATNQCTIPMPASVFGTATGRFMAVLAKGVLTSSSSASWSFSIGQGSQSGGFSVGGESNDLTATGPGSNSGTVGGAVGAYTFGCGATFPIGTADYTGASVSTGSAPSSTTSYLGSSASDFAASTAGTLTLGSTSSGSKNANLLAIAIYPAVGGGSTTYSAEASALTSPVTAMNTTTPGRALNAATLQSTAPVTLTQGVPTNANLYVIATLNGSAVVNTDLTGSASRDGSAFTAGTFTKMATLSSGTLYRAGPISLTAQPSGSTPKYKLNMTATAEIDILGAVLLEA